MRVATLLKKSTLLLAAWMNSSPAFPFGTINVDDACSYFGEAVNSSVTTFGSVQEAVNIVNRIIDSQGLAQNFTIEAASVSNAAAVIRGSARIILYNPDFINSVDAQTGTEWAAISIMAHEVAHHLNAHTLSNDGSRPPTELEADYFSGYVLQRMGATLDEATAAMRLLGSDQGTSTHPSKPERLSAITAGWQRSCESNPSCTQTSDDGPIDPPPPSFTDRCSINGQDVLITVNDEVVAQDGSLLGHRQPSYWPQSCAFDLTRADGGRYCVAFSGQVFQGTPAPVGFCSPY